MNNSAFISYRREASAFIARAVFQDLRANGIDAFIDIQNIDTGKFDTIIMNQIAARPYFLLILTPGTLERCSEQGDWLLKEIQQAVNLQRLIILLVSPNFKFEDCEKYLPEPFKTELPRWNAVNVPHDYFEEAMARLRTRFLKPTDLTTTPAPIADQKAVDKKIQAVISAQPVTETQLSAQDYFERGLADYDKTDYETAIADYSEAIRLDPNYADAYNNRGLARYYLGDFDGAIADYTLSIELTNSEMHLPYGNRGLAYTGKADFDRAIADYTEAIRLNPNYALAFNNRGLVYDTKGDYKAAISDYTEAIRLDPNYATAYNNRAIVYNLIGDWDNAIADYGEAIRFDPNFAAAYNNRGEAYFVQQKYDSALADFQTAFSMESENKFYRAGIGITLYKLKRSGEAKVFWKSLAQDDKRFLDADWVKRELDWDSVLVEAARELIQSL